MPGRFGFARMDAQRRKPPVSSPPSTAIAIRLPDTDARSERPLRLLNIFIALRAAADRLPDPRPSPPGVGPATCPTRGSPHPLGTGMFARPVEGPPSPTPPPMADQLTRINKYLSEIGYCSRRAADQLVAQGRVTINGKVPEMGTKVGPGDQIQVDGRAVQAHTQDKVYLAFNKPVGIVCTTDTSVERDNIIDYINFPTRIFPIGRLDKPSEGLIFLTDDGDIVNKILRARNNHEKEYIVSVDRPINREFIEAMSRGVPILDTVTRPCRVRKLDKHRFNIVLTQGLNRQIRRMCEYLQYNVMRLKRVRIMNVQLDVPVGHWRNLTRAELHELNRLCSDSAKTHEPGTPETRVSPSGGRDNRTPRG